MIRYCFIISANGFLSMQNPGCQALRISARASLVRKSFPAMKPGANASDLFRAGFPPNGQELGQL